MTSWNTLYRQFLRAFSSAHQHLDSQLVDFKQDTRGVSARFSNGSVAQTDLLIGADGAKEEGSRYLNSMWYWNVPEGKRLQKLLTDHTGRVRDYLIPPGVVQEKLVQDQWDIAADGL